MARTRNLVASAVAFAFGGVLAACGGGGGGSPANTQLAAPAAVPAPVVSPVSPVASTPAAGVYTVYYGQFSGVYTFLDNGAFSGLHFVSGSDLAGHPRGMLSKADSVKSPEPISWANFIDDSAKIGTQEPAGVFGRTFSSAGLQVYISGSMGNFSASAASGRTYTDGSTRLIYDDPLPLASVAGSYTGLIRTVGFKEPRAQVSDFNVDAAGKVSASVLGCSFAGTMVQHGKTGIFDAELVSSGANCPVRETFKGVVTPLEIKDGVPKLAFQLDSADQQKTAVFIVTRR